MKKNLLFAGLFVMLAFTLSGCVKVEENIVINDDGSAEVKMAMLFDKRLEPYLGAELDKAMSGKDSSSNKNFKVEKVVRDDYFVMESTNLIENIQKKDIIPLDDDIKTYNKDGRFLSVKKGFFKNVYTIDADFNLTSLKTTDSYKKLDPEAASMYQYELNIQIPSKAISTNSTDIKLNPYVYSWNIKFFQSNPVKLVFAIYNKLNIAITSAVAILFLLIMFISKKKKPQIQAEDGDN